ncbi:MAG: hypothetical protein R6X35_11830 [Candidatus Krumholzibacteriia bacterium]
MSDREFEDLVEILRRDHHTPPPVPADRLWARIAAAREARTARGRRRPGPAWWQAGLAAAAVLVVGIAIGRFALRPDPGPELAAGPAPAAAPFAPADRGREAPDSGSPPDDGTVQPLVRHTATSLFARADALLTDLQTGDCRRRDLAPLAGWAGGMLAQTRLLLDTPLAEEPDTRALLLDLELMLARIASLSPRDCTADVDRIRQDLQDKSTLERLRLAGTGRVDPRLL